MVVGIMVRLVLVGTMDDVVMLLGAKVGLSEEVGVMVVVALVVVILVVAAMEGAMVVVILPPLPPPVCMVVLG